MKKQINNIHAINEIAMLSNYFNIKYFLVIDTGEEYDVYPCNNEIKTQWETTTNKLSIKIRPTLWVVEVLSRNEKQANFIKFIRTLNFLREVYGYVK